MVVRRGGGDGRGGGGGGGKSGVEVWCLKEKKNRKKRMAIIFSVSISR